MRLTAILERHNSLGEFQSESVLFRVSNDVLMLPDAGNEPYTSLFEPKVILKSENRVPRPATTHL